MSLALPALAGGFFTTEPPGKPIVVLNKFQFNTSMTISFGEYVYWNFNVCQAVGSRNRKGCAGNGVGGVDGVQRTQTQTCTHTHTHIHTYTHILGTVGAERLTQKRDGLFGEGNLL